MKNLNYYTTLRVSSTATQAEIKRAYRHLAKLFHPDSNRDSTNHEQIASINVAYEVLSDPQKRYTYDRQLQLEDWGANVGFASQSQQRSRQQRAAAAVQDLRQQQQQQQGRTADEHLQQWLNRVYKPVNRLLCRILNPLSDQIDDLAADPFDDDLMAGFQTYLERCHDHLHQAQAAFRSMPNPSNTAGAAAHLYYCLNQVGDGLEELKFFTLNYDDGHLHTGQELFRIASGLRREAQAAVREVVPMG